MDRRTDGRAIALISSALSICAMLLRGKKKVLYCTRYKCRHLVNAYVRVPMHSFHQAVILLYSVTVNIY